VTTVPASVATTPPDQATTAPPTTEAASPTTTVEAMAIEISDGAVVGGALDLGVALGDEVVLVVTSDTEEQLHVHGYDLFFDIGPAGPTEVRFVADLPGVFDLELEASHVPVAELTVG
jgi:hypothetical protein